MNKTRTGEKVTTVWGLVVLMSLLTACGATTVQPSEENLPETTVSAPAETGETAVSALTETWETEVVVETTAETVIETIAETVEESSEELSHPEGPILPVGHQTIYSDGEIYGWTRYEYDESGRKDMIVFVTPTGNEYWSPVFYDGNGHVIPETVGTYSVMDENGLHLEVGTEDSRGRRTPMVTYAYDTKGNLTDYWYMYVNGKYLRHIVYSYDSRDHLIREELYLASNNRLESYVEYIYSSEDQLIRKNEVEDARQSGDIVYTIYQYSEEGFLIREEKIWGGRVHDYVDYYYNEDGVLTREYHFLEDKMMGGPYTVEYLFEAINDSAG